MFRNTHPETTSKHLRKSIRGTLLLSHCHGRANVLCSFIPNFELIAEDGVAETVN